MNRNSSEQVVDKVMLPRRQGDAPTSKRGNSHLHKVAIVAFLFVACNGCDDSENTPRGNSIADRYQDYMKVVEYARTLPAGKDTFIVLPPELRLKYLLQVYVERPKVYALEFRSYMTIDLNPIYIFVEDDVDDPEAAARAMCKGHSSWSFGRKLDEKGWYYVHGP